MDKILSELSSSLKQILKVKNPTHEATDNEEWFCGRDVCLILGFKNINRTLLEQVKKRTSVVSNILPWDRSPAPYQISTTRAEQSTFLRQAI